MLLRTVIGLLTLLYPIAVYYGLQAFDARYLVVLLLVVAAARMLTADNKTPLNHWLWLPLLGLLAIWSWLTNSALGLKFYPVLVNLCLLIFFAWSLKVPPSMIERFARIKDPELSQQGVRYTRKVTVVWCAFFIANGTIALLTTLFASDAIWAAYNGFIAYIAMGTLFAGEWLIRQRVMKASHD
ncbi:hypothetical protein [Pseudomaricurvus sp.]|uniref:hypothetical protein n=1 Tax=Pseudomaricurvus sp. TaxID=2004510 RepID=UPI003F6BA26A